MLVINKATYGGADCTEQISKLVRKGKLSVKANNDIIGDPMHSSKETDSRLYLKWRKSV